MPLVLVVLAVAAVVEDGVLPVPHQEPQEPLIQVAVVAVVALATMAVLVVQG
jgi:hypothetical protein